MLKKKKVASKNLINIVPKTLLHAPLQAQFFGTQCVTAVMCMATVATTHLHCTILLSCEMDGTMGFLRICTEISTSSYQKDRIR